VKVVDHGGARIPAELLALADPGELTTEELILESEELNRQIRRDGYRWECDVPDCDGLPHAGFTHKHARATQRLPVVPLLWIIWLILTGRGWGKTRTGAETVKKWTSERPRAVAVIAPTHRECRNVCFEAPKAGIIRVIPPEEVLVYNRSAGDLSITLRNGSTIRGFAAASPEAIRGYAFDKAWLDEYAACAETDAFDVWDNLMFAMRESDEMQIVVTTTPKPLKHVKALLRRADKPDGRIAITRGHMRDNIANLSRAVLEELEGTYAGTRVGRQELAGELLEDVEGALWVQAMFDQPGFRLNRDQVPDLTRVVVAIDPAAKSKETSDNHGITVAGRDGGRSRTFGTGRPHGYVLHNEGLHGRPEQAAARAIQLYHDELADAIIVEDNNGGDWIPAVINLIDPSVVVRNVTATRGKITRAEPVSTLYEKVLVHHVGPVELYEAVEDQMKTWVPGSKDGGSPDEMDSLVWALTDLFIDVMPEASVQSRGRAARRGQRRR
jgi:phage terminase large subunit-like protein